MNNKISIDQLPCIVIEPSKSIIDDFEILAFENEDVLNFYTVWHDTLYDKRRELNAESERERQIIRNEVVRKTQQFLLGSYECNVPTKDKERKNSRNATSKSRSSRPPPSEPEPLAEESLERAEERALDQEAHPIEPNSLIAPAAPVTPSPSKTSQASRSRTPSSNARRSNHLRQPGQSKLSDTNQLEVCQPPYLYYVPKNPDLPNGLTILNSTYYNTLPSGKGLMKYKLTKLYNKFLGRQMRRNYVLDKQKVAKIESEVSNSYLNPWLAYKALQAIRLPESNKNQLSTIAINNNPRFITIPQVTSKPPVTTAPPPTPPKKGSKNSKKQNHAPIQQAPATPQKPPMHLVYIDPNDIVTYSNKINPRQIAAYRKRPQILPSSATSKKSSAASYDVYEIMEVLANSDKTNVTITRNANKPAPNGQSIFSRSVNANTPGIVSTQLHLQAKSYLDSVSKFYSEEAERVAKEEENLRNEPSIEEQVRKYIKIFWPPTKTITKLPDYSEKSSDADCEPMNLDKHEEDVDEIEQLESDIRFMLRPQSESDTKDEAAMSA